MLGSQPIFVIINRPDGNKLYLNTDHIIYIMPDIIGDSKSRTEIVTTQGAFIVSKTLAYVLDVVTGEKKGEL